MAKKYKIERNLVLNNIKEGGAEDSVLVIDGSNEVGAVPRSEFGGGGSQNLDEVLETGNTSQNTITLTDSGNNSEANYSGIEVYISDNGAQNSGNLTASELNFYNDSNEGSTQHYENGKIRFESATAGKDLTLTFERNIAGIVEFKFPEKHSGNYTLATTDDIPTGLTQNITIGANIFTFTNGVLTDFETVEGPTGD